MSTLLFDIPEIEEAIGIPFDRWRAQCHSISLAIVQKGLVPGGRVMRGTATGVGSQHSWIVVGEPLDDSRPHANRINWGLEIIDPTLWSYRSDVEGIWSGQMTQTGSHIPFGSGTIWSYGQPQNQGGEPIVPEGLSKVAQDFIEMCDPRGLDRGGWMGLLHAPVEGWPSKNILTAANRDPRLSPIIPVDLVGNWTDENPDGLYF